MTRLRLRSCSFWILALTLVAACGEVVSDGVGGDDDGVDQPPVDGLVACAAPGDCAGDQSCVENAQGDGVCMTTCRLYDDSSCDAGETCVLGRALTSADVMVTHCRTAGAAATWESCDEATPCAANHSCWSNTCVPHCDDEHPCADSGLTCMPPANYPYTNPTNAGVCL